MLAVVPLTATLYPAASRPVRFGAFAAACARIGTPARFSARGISLGAAPAALRTAALNSLIPSTLMPPPLATPSHLRFAHRLLELFDLLIVIVRERLLYLDGRLKDRGGGDVQVGR